MHQKGIEINFKGDLCEACHSHMQNDPEKSSVFFLQKFNLIQGRK